MASRKRTRSARKGHASYPFNAAIFEIPKLEEMKLVDSGSDLDESALESELEALLSGKTKNKPVIQSAQPKKDAVAALDIEKIVAECMNDISDENSDNESLLTDPDLLKELDELTCGVSEGREEVTEIIEEKEVCAPIIKERASDSVTTNQDPPGSILPMLEQRLELYKQALSSAKGLGDNLKVRRFSRAKKTLEDLIKSAKSNKTVNIENIPPVVCIPKEKSDSLNKETLVTSAEPAVLSTK